MENQLQSLRKDLEDTLCQKAKLQTELDTATEYIIAMEEKVYKSNKISLELLEQLKDCEIELGSVPLYPYDYRSRYAGAGAYPMSYVYTAAPNDYIDIKMSEFINTHPDRYQLRQLFVRESEGFYSFGTKRINVKCENNQLKVRVGGGYVSIDEYVEQNIAFECAKTGADSILQRERRSVAELAKQIQARRSVSPNKRYGI